MPMHVIGLLSRRLLIILNHFLSSLQKDLCYYLNKRYTNLGNRTIFIIHYYPFFRVERENLIRGSITIIFNGWITLEN